MAIMAKLAFLSNYGLKSPPPPIVIFVKASLILMNKSLILKLIYRVTHILIRSENFWTFNMKGPV